MTQLSRFGDIAADPGRVGFLEKYLTQPLKDAGIEPVSVSISVDSDIRKRHDETISQWVTLEAYTGGKSFDVVYLDSFDDLAKAEQVAEIYIERHGCQVRINDAIYDPAPDADEPASSAPAFGSIEGILENAEDSTRRMFDLLTGPNSPVDDDEEVSVRVKRHDRMTTPKHFHRVNVGANMKSSDVQVWDNQVSLSRSSGRFRDDGDGELTELPNPIDEDRQVARWFAEQIGLPVSLWNDKANTHETITPASAPAPGGSSASYGNERNLWSGAAKDLCDDLDAIAAPPTVRLVALVMLMHRSKAGGEMWPSYSTIQRYTGLARSTVQSNVEWLLEHRVLKRTRKARRETSEPARYRFESSDRWTP